MNDLRFNTLEAADSPAFQAMTFPVYRHLLDLRPSTRHPEQADRRPIQPVAVAAYQDGRAVGLALAERPLVADQQPPELLSLFVEPDSRRQGVASGLLRALEQSSHREVVRRLQAVYTTGSRWERRGRTTLSTARLGRAADPHRVGAARSTGSWPASYSRRAAWRPTIRDSRSSLAWLPADEHAALQTSDAERRW